MDLNIKFIAEGTKGPQPIYWSPCVCLEGLRKTINTRGHCNRFLSWILTKIPPHTKCLAIQRFLGVIRALLGSHPRTYRLLLSPM